MPRHSIAYRTQGAWGSSKMTLSQAFEPMTAQLSHMKAVLPLAQTLVTASDHCTNTGHWNARILLLDKILTQWQHESCASTGSKADFPQHQVTVAMQALRLQDLCFYTQDFHWIAVQLSSENCAAIGSKAFDSMRSLQWYRSLDCKALVSKLKILSQ